jgi:CheY-like chemotaxis protein
VKKRILFLDDDHRRIATFREQVARSDFDLTVVETADECIEALASGRFDLVLLDHDLGGETFVDSSRHDTGMEVVRWIRTQGLPAGAFIVHTMNPVAATTMFFELQQLGHRVEQAPFGSSQFYRALEELLEVRTHRIRHRRKSLSVRLKEYFRSIRFK